MLLMVTITRIMSDAPACHRSPDLDNGNRLLRSPADTCINALTAACHQSIGYMAFAEDLQQEYTN